MNKLFLITWRWLKRDKRRTALTFASIVLSVYLISFVGVYMSTALSSFRAGIEYEEPMHATLVLDSLEQAEKLDKNAAWEKHAYHRSMESFMVKDFVRKYGTSTDSLFPVVTINGKSIFGEKNDVRASLVSGDAEELFGKAYLQLTGEMPKHANEVAISSALATKYGNVGIGDTITIRYDVHKGKFFYSELDENDEPAADENGKLIFKEDKYGFKLKQLYSIMQTYDLDLYGPFSKLYKVEEGGELPDESLGNFCGFEIPPAYVELSDECVDQFEYTATITGLMDGGAHGFITDIAFSPDDKEILPFFGDGEVLYDVRVKKGLDAEACCKRALKTFGLDNFENTNLNVNVDLLILEGRQLEYIGNVGLVFVLAAIIMGLFVFLARLIINNAFEISAEYRTEQYGALKTIGASDKQISTMIMFECGLYMLTALPLGVGLAVAVGRYLLNKVRDIAMYDPIYGSGVSDSFFKLELSPGVMLITILLAAFSIFFSSYADAMRVRRMPPIQSVGYGRKINARSKKSRWLSRRILGYSRGFAIKCISKQKVRFTVTLLAAVISGIFMMTFASMSDISNRNKLNAREVSVDLEAWRNEDITIDEEKELYDTLIKSGDFEEIIPFLSLDLSSQGDKDPNEQYYSGTFKQLQSEIDRNFFNGSSDSKRYASLWIKAIPREIYDKYIDADMTYDEFVASGKPLFANTIFRCYYSDKEREQIEKEYGIKEDIIENGEIMECVLEKPVFEGEKPDEFIFGFNYINTDEETGERESKMYYRNIECGGFYTTDDPSFMSDGYDMIAIVPFESFSEDIIPPIILDNGEEFEEFISVGSFKLTMKKGREERARSLVKSCFDDVEDYTVTRQFGEKKAQTITVAGEGFAVSLAVVVLLNLFSTMSANIINRRRDLSMMRSCGMSLKQVRRSLFFEGRIYAGITTLISSLAGWLLSMAMYAAYTNVDFNVAPIKLFPWKGAIALFAIIMLVITAAFMPALMKMKKENIAQEIKTDI